MLTVDEEEMHALQKKITTQHLSLLEKEETICQLKEKLFNVTKKLKDYETLNQVSYSINDRYVQGITLKELSNTLQDTDKIKKAMSMELDRMTRVTMHVYLNCIMYN